ncbi:5-aminolevulinate synthase 1-like [Glandiceps talaboti]
MANIVKAQQTLETVLHNLSPKKEGDLRLTIGQIVEVEGLLWKFQGTPQQPKGWLFGRAKDSGERGNFPASFVSYFGEEVSLTKSTPSQPLRVTAACESTTNSTSIVTKAAKVNSKLPKPPSTLFAHQTVKSQTPDIKVDQTTQAGLLKGDMMFYYESPLELNDSTFNYEAFFKVKINQKKVSNTYHVLKKVERDATRFPYAQEFSNIKKDGEAGKYISLWCSNDYLAMSRHPAVTKAVTETLMKEGAAAGGSRNITGTTTHHVKLEKQLAQWHQKEAGLVFTSCFVANDSTLFTLAKNLPGLEFYSDISNHASLIQGIRNGGVPKYIFRHNDPAHLEELLMKSNISAPKIVVFESVHSMTGDVCPMEELCDVAHRYGALTFCDEDHAIGLYGDKGAGIAERDGMQDKVDIISGTLGKAIGNIGGFIVGSSNLIDMIRSYAAGFIYTTALPPMNVAGALAAVKVLSGPEGQELRHRHQKSVRELRSKLAIVGIPMTHSPSHIIPIHVGNPEKCTKVASDMMNKHNIYVHGINFPTVPLGEELLRVTPTPFHNSEMIDGFVKSIVDVWKDNGLTLKNSVYTSKL